VRGWAMAEGTGSLKEKAGSTVGVSGSDLRITGYVGPKTSCESTLRVSVKTGKQGKLYLFIGGFVRFLEV